VRHFGKQMAIGIPTANSVVAVRVEKHLKLLVVVDQFIDELQGILRMHIIISAAVNYQQMAF
jgi:hypothetical protein